MPYTPTAQQVEDRKAALAEAHEKLKAGIADLMTPEMWQRLIESHRWLRYSLNNQMLILLQCPGATDVRPFGSRVNPKPGSWKAVGRYANSGPGSSIKIFAPLFRKDDNGESHVYGFKLVPVFDVSQTDGEPLADVQKLRPELLTGDAPAFLWDKVAKLVADAGFSLAREIDSDAPKANGTTTWSSRTVRVRPDLDPAQAVKTLIHELAHVLLGHEDRDISRNRAEVEAESVACVVASIAGLDSLAYSVPYVAGWAGSTDEVEESAKVVLKTADKIVKDLEIEV